MTASRLSNIKRTSTLINSTIDNSEKKAVKKGVDYQNSYQQNGQTQNSDFNACIEVNSDSQTEFDSVSAK